MIFILYLLLSPVESLRAHHSGILGELVTLTCPSSSNSKKSQVGIEWILPQTEEIIGPTNQNQSNYQLLPSGNLAIRGNFLRAFVCASLAACCFGTCCAIYKFRWKETKGGNFSCPRDSTQIQFLPDESGIDKDMDRDNQSSVSSPKLLRESPQGEEDNSRNSLLDSFPFFDAESSEETLGEIPLSTIMPHGDTRRKSPTFYTNVQNHNKYLSIRGNPPPVHYLH